MMEHQAIDKNFMLQKYFAIPYKEFQLHLKQSIEIKNKPK